MTKEEFLKGFQDQFEETDPASITFETKFREIEEWSSMMALVIIAYVDENYSVNLTGDDIRTSETVSDIYEKIASK